MPPAVVTKNSEIQSVFRRYPSHVSRHPFPHLEPTCRRRARRFHHRSLHNGLPGQLSEPKNHDTKNITQTSLHYHKITLQHGVLQYCQHPRNRDLQKRRILQGEITVFTSDIGPKFLLSGNKSVYLLALSEFSRHRITFLRSSLFQ